MNSNIFDSLNTFPPKINSRLRENLPCESLSFPEAGMGVYAIKIEDFLYGERCHMQIGGKCI